MQVTSHHRGASVRVALKRLPANNVFEVLLITDHCNWAYGEYHDCKTNVSRHNALIQSYAVDTPVLASPVIPSVTAANGHAAIFAFMSLNATPRAMLLRNGGAAIACAELDSVPALSIGPEARVYETAELIAVHSTAAAPNAWPALTTHHEHQFQVLKEDVIRWLPSTPKSLDLALSKKITIAMVGYNCLRNYHFLLVFVHLFDEIHMRRLS